MDLHIERPELNGQSVEENIARIDTWIADTADQLNAIAPSLKARSTTSATSEKQSGSSGATVGKSEYLKQLAQGVHVGDYKANATEVILEG